jgi:serine/threonine-protein kinase
MTNSGQVTALRCDQRRRWQQGERILVESYLEQQPTLQADPEGLLDLIYNEMVLREEHGDSPRLEEYLQRFPQFATQLRLQFQVHQALEGISFRGEQAFSGNDPGSQTAPVRGGTIAGYEILEELGRGGMGVVYRAVQVDLKRPVAIKMILAGAYAGAREQARFRIEAEAAARLQHPNIVQIYEVGEQDGCLFLALELVDGVSLEKKFAGQPVPAHQAGQLVETLAQAMRVAHERGIIHRDLKPSNVLLTSAGVPKITDFGLAKLLDARANQTPSDAFLGTPSYMAPEQAFGRREEIGPATDVYALGAILYQLLTGRPPFEGNNAMETLLQVQSHEPVPPRRWQPAVPPDLETICLKCLHKEPARRYASASDLADDLRRFLAHEPIQARPVTAAERLVKWMRRRPSVAALVAVSCAAVLSLTAILGWHHWDRQIVAEQARDQEHHALEQARRNYQQFLQSRDEALFYGIYGTLFTDADAARNLSTTAAAAREALALMAVPVEGDGLPVLNPALSASEQAEVLAGCYQLLLVLAEVAAHGSPEPQADDPGRPIRQALTLLDRAAQLGPATPAYHLRRARYLHQLGDEAGARQERARAESLKPAGALDYFLLGQEQFRQGKVEQACADFQKALLLRPDDFWSQYFLAVGYLKTKRPAEARDCLTKCAEQRPGFIWTYLVRSLAHEQSGAFAAAEADYQTALELHPNDDAGYFLSLNRGRMRLQQRNFAAAVADFQQAITLKPNLYDAYLDLARVYHQERRWDEAGRELERAIQRRPPSAALANYHAERSHQLYRDQAYPESLEACDRALAIDPGYAAVHALRGRVLMQLRRYEQAAAAFDRYLAHGGKPVAAVYRERGMARMKLGNYLGAVDDYTHALERQPDTDLYTHRGWAYFFADAWKPALHDFEEALRLDPEYCDAYIGRGLAHVMLGQSREAVGDAEEALQRKPATPEMMHNIACIFALAAGKPDVQSSAARYRDQAVEAVRKTLALVPPSERSSFWRDKIVPDKALDAIRTCSAFKQLAQEYAKSPLPM